VWALIRRDPADQWDKVGGRSLLRYPAGSLYPDYARTALGLAVTLGPVLLLDLADGVALLLGGLGFLFVWFGSRTMVRQLTRVELSGDGVTVFGPAPRRLAWSNLERLKLAYYAPRRSREDGWLQLTLSGPGSRPIRLDSTLSGFDRVLAQATRVAQARALSLDRATRANLVALGLSAAAESADAIRLAPESAGCGQLGSMKRS
jgi:hypothetical protein